MRHICEMRCPAVGAEPRNEIAVRLDSTGWGLFFLWVGVSFLLDVGWGIGLLGVGILTLAMQALRRAFGLQIQCFWVVVGSGFTLAGVLELGAIDVAILPILLMAVGVLVLVSAFRRTQE